MKYTIIITSLLLWLNVAGQERVFWQNASFEQSMSNGQTAAAWSDCGDNNESVAQLLPDPNSDLQALDPHQGFQYLGLRTYKDGSYQALGQELTTPLLPGSCYALGVYLARATRPDTTENDPLCFRIWGGNDYCDRWEILAETFPVNHQDWQEYLFTFSPVQAYRFITIEAYYDRKAEYAYDGWLLVDHLSAIYPVNCSTTPERRMVAAGDGSTADFRPKQQHTRAPSVNYAAIADTINFPAPDNIKSLEKLIVLGGHSISQLLPSDTNNALDSPTQLQQLQAKRLINAMRAFPERTLILTMPAERPDRLTLLDQLLRQLGTPTDSNIQSRNWQAGDDQRRVLMQDELSGLSIYLE